MNIYAILISGLVPLIVGFLWYNNSFGFGKLWLKESGTIITQQDDKRMPLTIGLTLLFGMMVSLSMGMLVIHQAHLDSIIALPDATDAMKADIKMIHDKYDNLFRTFKHGAFHGFMWAIFLGLPFIGISGLYEKKSFKYIMIHLGYWTTCLTIMGGIISGWQ